MPRFAAIRVLRAVPRPRWPLPLASVLAVAVLLTGTVALAAWYSTDQADRRARAGADALAGATAATAAIFSYDYRRFDASVTNGKLFVTGDFAKEYAETTGTLKAAAEKEQAVVRAEVSAASVVHADPDRVEVLLYVNQYRRNANIEGEKVDQNRIVLTLVPVDGEWMVSHATAI
jgi:Mce-associated membrane protein